MDDGEFVMMDQGQIATLVKDLEKYGYGDFARGNLLQAIYKGKYDYYTLTTLAATNLISYVRLAFLVTMTRRKDISLENLSPEFLTDDTEGIILLVNSRKKGMTVLHPLLRDDLSVKDNKAILKELTQLATSNGQALDSSFAPNVEFAL
jgi:hypothetical protein